MTHRINPTLAAAALLIAVCAITGCAAAPTLSEADVVGTWALEQGGTVTFDADSVEFDELFVSPLSGPGTDVHFSGTGSWKLDGKSSVAIELPEWTSDLSGSAPGTNYTSRLKAVQRGGEIQFDIFESGTETNYYLEKK